MNFIHDSYAEFKNDVDIKNDIIHLDATSKDRLRLLFQISPKSGVVNEAFVNKEGEYKVVIKDDDVRKDGRKLRRNGG